MGIGEIPGPDGIGVPFDDRTGHCLSLTTELFNEMLG